MLWLFFKILLKYEHMFFNIAETIYSKGKKMINNLKKQIYVLISSLIPDDKKEIIKLLNATDSHITFIETIEKITISDITTIGKPYTDNTATLLICLPLREHFS